MEEKHSAMLVVCKKGSQIEKHRVSERFVIEGCGEIVKDKEIYEYRDSGKSRIYYNGQVLNSWEAGIQPVELREGDVLGLRDTDADEWSCVYVFHRIYSEETVWRTVEMDDTQKHFYISRHEEMKSSEEVQPEDVAELPDHYAELFREGQDWYVNDHNTRLGVYVNNRKREERTLLKELDIVRVGNTLFLFKDGKLYYDHKDLSSNSLVIHIEERSVWNFFRKKVLLEDINMKIYPGEMILILGGSGAGKTTFINAVMGYEKAEGEILSGDINVYKNYNMMKYEIGFVPQQDLLRMEDEVYSTLENAAEIKMPKSTTDEERTARIKQVMQLFGLEQEAESLVSKLSGGQRKRLSIAVEYIADPSLFFLDEPDSGLDGVMARVLMENLRGIANEKKIVLVITHSPDRVSDLFNKVIVLAKSREGGSGR